jgi:thioredoxin reductase
MKYLLLEQGEFGGSILHYPRQKVVMTAPVEIPLWGKFRRTEISKEELLETWQRILDKTQLAVHQQEKVDDIRKEDGRFSVQSSKELYHARHVVLALGRRGTPRKLGVPGEHLGKVMYRLIEPEAFRQSDVLVVGGGDSAVEAALGLASVGGIRVTLCYRKSEFSRIKERNASRFKEHVAQKTIQVLFNSEVLEIAQDRVSLRVSEAERSLRNDHVFVFAGGEMPFDFLRNVGIAFHE